MQQKLQVPPIHAAIVGSDVTAQTKFESEIRTFVRTKKIETYVHFVNKTLAVAPYLAAIDVLVQNSQVMIFLFFYTNSSFIEMMIGFLCIVDIFMISPHVESR